jgi:hypothetical protein
VVLIVDLAFGYHLSHRLFVVASRVVTVLSSLYIPPRVLRQVLKR